jgi:hypothetical protein
LTAQPSYEVKAAVEGDKYSGISKIGYHNIKHDVTGTHEISMGDSLKWYRGFHLLRNLVPVSECLVVNHADGGK